ncbi:RagB/SusD family nutrient uptake outer membrane protein [Rufibacter sp. XAAS-G3-1]|uniref:RagB/SusD family nutrient uptake outer membrane protein n=1 Tax=Rufibacter sp. XAAS-G3-1 TaxID=2729134 RepID=UPI0015E6F205|nr:RagB/SusD family nutrient uptake outer membrane protein [Rufibacter sp. XAAS-G3-1]
MKKLSKYTSIALLGSLSLTGLSCNDFLDREPLGRFTTETYPAGGLTQYVYGMYSDLRSWGVHAFAFVGITSITSDDADKGSTPADGADQLALDNFTILPANGLITDFYRAHYTAISKCNIVLQQAEALRSTITPEDYTTSQAEARFIRAYLYFNLVRTYGRVPIVDKVFAEGDNFNIPQSSKAQLYAFIEQDLQFAAASLPSSWGTGFAGRPTSWTAQAMLAKVYLYQQKWGAALSSAQAVMGSGMYDLSVPYNQIFTETRENSRESVFEVQAVYTRTNQFGTQYAEVQGFRGSGAQDLGWGFNSPSLLLHNAYEPNDPRREATILYRGETTPYGETMQTTPPNERYNQKVYTNPSVRTTVGNQKGYWMNIRLLRYADVVLMAAEAANELGGTANTDIALANLEMVRARARGNNAAILPRITERNQAALRTLIRQERRIELAMEHERFYDLVRWGIAGDVLRAAGKNFVTGKHEVMPIPQSEIDKSAGVLTQNPNY